jgi:hypothetical protein
MAGTIVADTLQNGAGTSTSMDNAINGSAKAWVKFSGQTGTRSASYNVSSVTRGSTGQYTVNFTTAMSDTNYCVVSGASQSTAGSNWTVEPAINQAGTATGSFTISIVDYTASSYVDPYFLHMAIFR